MWVIVNWSCQVNILVIGESIVFLLILGWRSSDSSMTWSQRWYDNISPVSKDMTCPGYCDQFLTDSGSKWFIRNSALHSSESRVWTAASILSRRIRAFRRYHLTRWSIKSACIAPDPHTKWSMHMIWSTQIRGSLHCRTNISVACW
jgi:hypothetical protein